jgi:hypothetical protein
MVAQMTAQDSAPRATPADISKAALAAIIAGTAPSHQASAATQEKVSPSVLATLLAGQGKAAAQAYYANVTTTPPKAQAPGSSTPSFAAVHDW